MILLAACVAPPPIPDGADFVQRFRITAWEWDYDPEVAHAYTDYPIIFRVESLDVEHTLTCDELGVNIVIPPRQVGAVEQEFIVAKPGTYRFYSAAKSGPGVSRQVFKLYVKEAPRM